MKYTSDKWSKKMATRPCFQESAVREAPMSGLKAETAVGKKYINLAIKTLYDQMIFTVAKADAPTKPTIWAQSCSNKSDYYALVDQYCKDHSIEVDSTELAEAGEALETIGVYWLQEHYCFEVTPVHG